MTPTIVGFSLLVFFVAGLMVSQLKAIKRIHVLEEENCALCSELNEVKNELNELEEPV